MLCCLFFCWYHHPYHTFADLSLYIYIFLQLTCTVNITHHFIIQENDDTETSGGLGRRSTRARAQTVFFTDTTLQESYDRERGRDGSDDDDGSASEGGESNESSDDEVPVRRKSSRSNAFRGGMKEPSDSIADLTRTEEPSNNKKRRGARAQRSSLEASGGGDESEDESEL